MTFHRFILSAVAVAALLSGCALPDFAPYSGQQQNWPTQPGAFVNTRFGFPIYLDGYPSQPYSVIGTIYLNDTPGWVSYAVAKAKRIGANALIALPKGYGGSVGYGNSFTAGNFYPGGFNANTTGFSASTALTRVQFIAIKWR